MRVTTGMVQRSVLADLNRVSERLTHTQTKLASNREITRPSDDPFNASRALALRQSLEEARQHQRNVEDAQGWQDATEQALAQITDTVQRARELAVTAANGAINGQARESIAAEVDQLIDSVKQYANSTYRGAYLLSGTDSDRAPFAWSATCVTAPGPGPEGLDAVCLASHAIPRSPGPSGSTPSPNTGLDLPRRCRIPNECPP